jgi:hypothetical protein
LNGILHLTNLVYSYLLSTHLIGPGDLVDCPSKPLGQVAFTDGLNLAKNNQLIAGRNYPSTDALTSTLIRIQLGRYEPLSTFSVMLRANDQYQGEQHAFFQFTVTFVDISRQSLVTQNFHASHIPSSIKASKTLWDRSMPMTF